VGVCVCVCVCACVRVFACAFPSFPVVLQEVVLFFLTKMAFFLVHKVFLGFRGNSTFEII